MKELVIQIQESEYAFIAKLLQQFSFVKIKENNATSVQTAATSKTAYLFSPEAFEELYDKVADDSVGASEILAEFEKRKIVETP
jgi:hypothetical protein